jgi:hypothetical protein
MTLKSYISKDTRLHIAPDFDLPQFFLPNMPLWQSSLQLAILSSSDFSALEATPHDSEG